MDKATPTPSPSLYEKIERYGAYRFAHGHNEANQHYDISDREQANAKTLLAEIRAEVERLAAQSAPTEPTVPLAKSRVGRVYLAGPMTGYENFNFSAFNAAAQRLRAEGFDVVNPADHGIVDGAEWADYLRFDLGKLAQCESIALLPGWEVSKGANLEVSVAQKLGIVVRCLDGAAQPSQAPVVQAGRCGRL